MRDVMNRLDAVLRVLGALVGTLPVAILVAGALAAYLPVSPSVGYIVGALLFVPLWVAGMCAGLLARRGWQLCLVLGLAFAALRVLAPAAVLP